MTAAAPPLVHRTTTAELGSLTLETGEVLPSVALAYDTYGTLSAQADNAILIEHALTGDSHAHEWWPGLIGPGRPLDTERWFVVCANVLGGCSGSTGPNSPGPDGEPYGSDFQIGRASCRERV